MVEFVSPALMAEMRDYERTVKRLRKELAEKDAEIERLTEELDEVSGIAEEQEKEIERLKAALNEIATTELICPDIYYNKTKGGSYGTAGQEDRLPRSPRLQFLLFRFQAKRYHFAIFRADNLACLPMAKPFHKNERVVIFLQKKGPPFRWLDNRA